ncbi:MAG: tetratricopeptide repeat protein, partial [Phaeodactylibacter sp.]|nr:tetratricopeptide repeat protein [Phaeodactylibacter sp.]
MASGLIERVPLKQLVKSCTVKLLSSPGGKFLGTGFFVAPDKLATCCHVFFNKGKAVTAQFRIENYEGEFSLDGNYRQHEGLDLLAINLGALVAERCINLEAAASQVGDRLWGWSYNTNYPEGGGLVPVLQEEARHNGWDVLRVSRDIVKQGSSGTPVLNVESGKLLGVTYWLKEGDALVIPALYFKEHFEELYRENQEHHRAEAYWEEARRQSRQQRVKRLTTIPPIDNKDVVGRAEDLETLRQRLQGANKVLLMNGIGGIGKTTLAKLYVNNYAEEYGRLLWVEQKEGLEKDIAANAALLKALGIENASGLDAGDIFNQAMLALQNFDDGLNLLVVDNATRSVRDVKGSLPHGPHWHVLLTSRQVVGAFELMELGRLGPTSAKALFRKHCSKPQEEEPLDAFLEKLERHTLSIELFAKILDTHWQLESVEELGEFLDHKQVDEEILQTVVELEHAGGETQLYRHLLSAFDLSGIAARPERLLVLQRMAALPPAVEGYPVKDLIEWFGIEQEEATAFVNHLQELYKLGWLTQPQKNYFGLHRLIGTIVSKAHPAGPEQLAPLVQAFADKLSIDQTKDNPIHKFRWAPFGLALLETLGAAELEEKSRLQNNLATVLQDLGDYQGARELLEKAMRSDEQNFGAEHPTTAVRYSNLATVLQDLGDYQGARELLEKAMRSA